MGISDLFEAVGGEERVHHECRDCGKNLAPPTDRCPACGGDVSRYDLE